MATLSSSLLLSATTTHSSSTSICSQSHTKFTVSLSLSLSPPDSPRNSLSICSPIKPSTALFMKPRSVAPSGLGRPRLSSPVCQLPSLSDVEPKPVKTSDGFTEFPSTSGVYAVYDSQGQLQYVGLSRKLSASIKSHAEELPELCNAVKVIEVSASERSALTDAWKSVMEIHIAAGGELPPGNQQGNTTWTTRKVKRAKPDLRLTPGPHVKLNITLSELIDIVVKEHQVVAFIKGSRSAPECGFSHKVLTILNDAGVNYESVNVLDEKHNYGIREEIKTYSQWPTIPQVFVKGEFIGGADILEEMATNGELAKLLSNK